MQEIEVMNDDEIVLINGIGFSGALFRFFSNPENAGKLFELRGKHEGGIGVDIGFGELALNEYQGISGYAFRFVMELMKRPTFLRHQIFRWVVGMGAYYNFAGMFVAIYDMMERKNKKKEEDGDGDKNTL